MIQPRHRRGNLQEKFALWESLYEMTVALTVYKGAPMPSDALNTPNPVR